MTDCRLAAFLIRCLPGDRQRPEKPGYFLWARPEASPPAGENDPALVIHRIHCRDDAAADFVGSARREDFPSGNVAEQRYGVVRKLLHLGQRVLEAEVEDVDADPGKVGGTHQPAGVVVEESHGDVERLEDAFEIRQCRRFEIVVPQKTDDIVEDEYAVD